MSIPIKLLAEPGRNASPAYEPALAAFRDAVETGVTGGLSGVCADCVSKIRQAEEKRAAGTPVARLSEILTLAQFGGGSIGRAIADIYDEPHAAANLQAVYIARFLTEIVADWQNNRAMLPQDILRKSGTDRDTASWPDAAPALEAILARAEQAASSVPISGAPNRSAELATLIAFERRLIEKTVRRARKSDPSASPVRLGFIDRLAVRVSLRLHRRGAA